MKTAIIIPNFNDNQKLDELIHSIHVENKEDIIIVDDGSKKQYKSNNTNISVLYNETNRGKGYSLLKGFKYAYSKGYIHAITLDADLQHNPLHIKEFINSNDNNDLVLGYRIFSKEMPIHRRISNVITSKLVSLIVKEKILDSQCGFRRYNIKKVLDDTYIEMGFQFESEVIIKLFKGHLKFEHIPISTIYNNEISSMNNIMDTIKFIRLIIRSIIF